MKVRVGIGGIIPEWKKPQVSMSSTNITIKRHLEFIRFLRSHGLTYYSPMPRLCAWNSYKNYRASGEVEKHKAEYKEMGFEMRKLGVVGDIECSKYCYLASTKDYVLEYSVDEVLAHSLICEYTREFKQIIVHFGKPNLFLKNVRRLLPDICYKYLTVEVPEHHDLFKYLNVCKELGIKPFLDTGHLLVQKVDVLKWSLKISEFWSKEFFPLAFNITNSRGKHLPLTLNDLDMLKGLIEMLESLGFKEVWIGVESPRETRLHDSIMCLNYVSRLYEENRKVIVIN